MVEDSSQKLGGYPKLRDEVLYLVSTKMLTNEESTVKHLYDHVEAQKSFMNTKHPDFKQFRFKLEPNKQDDEVMYCNPE